jgi:hypothetical protein
MEKEKPPISDTEKEKPKKEDPYLYHHRVESCPCGTCWLSRYHRDTWKN